jgi:hypothetical protein
VIDQDQIGADATHLAVEEVTAIRRYVQTRRVQDELARDAGHLSDLARIEIEKANPMWRFVT